MGAKDYSSMNGKKNDETDETATVKEEQELSFGSKICFGIAGLPYQLYYCAISVFATVFLLEVAKMPPVKSSYILFVSRFMDAITDPLYGFLVNRTKITKYGRLKPWMALSLPFIAVCYVMMWFVPYSFSENGRFAWFIVWHSLIFTVLTGFRIPYTSMTMYLCNSQAQRQSATVFRMAFEMLGILLALGIQAPIATTSSCTNPNEIVLNATNGSNATTMATTTTAESMMEAFARIERAAAKSSFWEDYKYAIVALGFAIVFVICNILLLVFVKERTDIVVESPDAAFAKKRLSTMRELGRIFTFKPYVVLFAATLLNTFAIQIVQANLQLYFNYGYTAINKYFTYSIVGILVLATLLVPVWNVIMIKFGKRKAFILGNLALVPCTIGIIFFRTGDLGQVIPFFIMMALASNTFTTAFLVPWAMLPECVDDYFLKYLSKPDALFYTFFILGTKVLMAIYLGITQLVLSMVNYETGVCAEYQNKSVQTAVIYLTGPGPLVFLLLSSVIIFFYPIDEAKAKENTNKIKKLSEQVRKPDDPIYTVESSDFTTSARSTDYDDKSDSSFDEEPPHYSEDVKRSPKASFKNNNARQRLSEDGSSESF